MKRHRVFLAIIAILSTNLINIPIAHAAVCVSGKSTFTGNGTIGLSNVLYTVESFTSVVSGCTWTVPAGVIRVDALIIGGGGGGGSWVGAGGGAGAMIDTTSLTVTPGTSISITVGDGGVGSVTNDVGGAGFQSVGANGSNSIFNSITALGGGVGGSWNQAAGTNTGSGGGGAGSTGINPGSKTNASYGNDGGSPNVNYNYGYPTGGGGGAGAVGGTGSVTVSVRGNSGNGGDGKISTITGASSYYGGGGGGGCHGNGGYPCVPGNGGNGGGGNGDGWIASDTVVNGGAGLLNTGSGGGGSGNPYRSYGSASYGGKGGSGVVIIRYVSNLILNPELGSGRVNATTATYRTATSFTVNAPINGKATFYEKNKVISTCKNKSAVAGATITCTWKPSLRGKVPLRIDYFQTGSNSVLERAYLEIWVNNRSGNR
jgi:hypothetical protein